MNEVAIEVRNISKKYVLGTERYIRLQTLAGVLVKLLRKNIRRIKTGKHEEEIVQALVDVSFDVHKGEAVGIIGPNGAGKSTILKILSQITMPDSGMARIYGRVASMLEVGTGFHLDLTGRENIYINGTMLGMRKAEIDARFDDIVEYAGVSKFIDTPLKKFSSGMMTRLAFAVAAHLDAEILIIDEVLAVGDADFQQKCLAKMDDVARNQGRTVLFVSHNMNAVKSLCPRSIYIRDGKVLMDGPSAQVIQQYLNENLTSNAFLGKSEVQKITEYYWSESEPTVLLNSIAVRDKAMKARKSFSSDEEIHISLEIEALKTVKDLRVVVSLVDEDNSFILSSQISDSWEYLLEHNSIEKGIYTASCTIPANLLGNNEYFITVEMINPYMEHLVVKKAMSFEVKFKGYTNIQLASIAEAYMRPQLNWQFEQVKEKVVQS
jgi:lipopolysaccharide transport system ATP-binding protein